MRKQKTVTKEPPKPPPRPDYPKRHKREDLSVGDMVFYGVEAERFWIESLPESWDKSFYVRISDKRIRPGDFELAPVNRMSFFVHADLLHKVQYTPRNPYAKRQPTPASEARKARAAAGDPTALRDVGDPVAVMLREAGDLDGVYKIGAKYLNTTEEELRARYKHLNNGQQRMNIGNRMRAQWKKTQKLA